MAKKEDGSKTDAKRKRAGMPDAASNPGTDLLEVIEEERARLMKAVDMLHCVLVAMDEVEGGDFQGPYYPSVLETVRDLLNQSINQLDSVRLRPLLEGAGRNAVASPEPGPEPGRNEVKEPPPPKYVH